MVLFNKLFLYVLLADVDVPVVYLNDEWVYDRIGIQEGKLLYLSCFVDANPTPTVRIGKSRNGRTVILYEAMDQWSNYSFSTGAKCSDTGTYIRNRTRSSGLTFCVRVLFYMSSTAASMRLVLLC